MKKVNFDDSKIPILLVLFGVLFFFACKNAQNNKNEEVVMEQTNTKSTVADVDIAVEPPPFTEGIFPCSECHLYIDPNPERRELVAFHDSISSIFDHDSENRWCLDCHDMNNRDSLRLASGKLLSFDESYKLCGQCHGDKLRDWKVGVHGKRTGYWDGKKEYLLCVNCHNPHSPRFKALTPEPPPVLQSKLEDF